jgi:hypothetical protein
MEDRNSPNKIKIAKQLFFLNESRLIKWSDIKHLELENDDTIHSYWDNEDNGFYGAVIRMVEETDEQYQKRLSNIEQDKERMKKSRYESYLRFKKEFEG